MSDATARRLRFGALVMPTDPWPETVARARHLEALGYDHLWIYDHLSWRRFRDEPWHATYPWLAGVASATDRIRLGTMVSNPNLRHPLVLAKDAMTIDTISDGRMIVGLGAGGLGFDATVLGQEPLSPGQRMDRLEEYAPLLAGLLSGEIRNHSGDWYEVEEARLLPGCVQRPRVPIAIAAGGRRGVRLAAEIADAWITSGSTSDPGLTPEQTEQVIREQIAMHEERCAEIGREPSDLDRIHVIGTTRERPLADIERFSEFVDRYAELGFTDFVFHDPRPGDQSWDDPPGIVEAIAACYLSDRR